MIAVKAVFPLGSVGNWAGYCWLLCSDGTVNLTGICSVAACAVILDNMVIVWSLCAATLGILRHLGCIIGMLMLASEAVFPLGYVGIWADLYDSLWVVGDLFIWL